MIHGTTRGKVGEEMGEEVKMEQKQDLHLSIKNRISCWIEGKILIVSKKTVFVFYPSSLPVMPGPVNLDVDESRQGRGPAMFENTQSMHMPRHQVPPGGLLEISVLLETLLKPVVESGEKVAQYQIRIT